MNSVVWGSQGATRSPGPQLPSGTMRYLSTIQAEESLRVQQDVEFAR